MAKNTKAQLSARAIESINSDGTSQTAVTYTIGKYKLTDKDLDTLILLRKVTTESPAVTYDQRDGSRTDNMTHVKETL